LRFEKFTGQSRTVSLKAITLLALTFMTRPSDLAPRAQVFYTSDNSVDMCVLLRDYVQLHHDKSMTITFFGVKNDTSRTVFEVRVPPSKDLKTEPVDA
jgi:hypothetical protein